MKLAVLVLLGLLTVSQAHAAMVAKFSWQGSLQHPYGGTTSDYDGDGRDDIIGFVDSATVAVFAADGTVKWQYGLKTADVCPSCQGVALWNSPAYFANVDSAPGKELVLSWTTWIYVNGNPNHAEAYGSAIISTATKTPIAWPAGQEVIEYFYDYDGDGYDEMVTDHNDLLGNVVYTVWGQAGANSPVLPIGRDGGLGSHAVLVPISANPSHKAFRFRLEGGTPGGVVSVRICDVTGRIVKRFQTTPSRESGESVVLWDGTDEHGAPAANGTYTCTLEGADLNLRTQKLTVVR